MSNVFISYAREDRALVQRLNESLEAHQRETWVDWEGIAPTAEWMGEIYAAIDGADAAAFVISPYWVSSRICRQELEHAVQRGKRLIPIVHREVPESMVPPALARLNWIFLRDQDDFEAGLAQLLKALDTDLDWVRAHTRLTLRATAWRAGDRDAGALLRGRDLVEAQRWLANAAAHSEPAPSPVQQEYVTASALADRRRQRIAIGLAVTALVISAGLSAWAWRERAIAQENATEARAQKQEADAQRNRALQALDASERELLRAQSSELRGLLQRLDTMIAASKDQQAKHRLQTERDSLMNRLERTTAEHQRRLALAIGFRGDLGFLQRWEGVVGGVRRIGTDAYIDPATSLNLSKPETIRQRYEFLLTPDEMTAVLALVGVKGEASGAVWQENLDVLCRIRLGPADVARLVPEVAGEFWQRLVRAYPVLLQPATSPAVQTALLSLAFNGGVNKRRFDPIIARLQAGDVPGLAQALETSLDGTRVLEMMPALKRRRIAEANLIRVEGGLPVTQDVQVPALMQAPPASECLGRG